MKDYSFLIKQDLNADVGSIEHKNCTTSSSGPLERGIGKKILILMELKDSEFMPTHRCIVIEEFLNNIFIYIKRDRIQIQ